MHYHAGAIIVAFVIRDGVCINRKLLCKSGKMA
ncbi:hypothetical protein Dda3937_03092 [Dickeya dadantii 3937]|uniref:Uncharacterized protein n=1 Tax=Dickeya dadantii (strain 3937) TaxID=198628 RepID=E0SFG1_DICD3|nr:hypothetical protein Dda3937_03092 [Dickeya dadantii 3937]